MILATSVADVGETLMTEAITAVFVATVVAVATAAVVVGDGGTDVGGAVTLGAMTVAVGVCRVTDSVTLAEMDWEHDAEELSAAERLNFATVIDALSLNVELRNVLREPLEDELPVDRLFVMLLDGLPREWLHVSAALPEYRVNDDDCESECVQEVLGVRVNERVATESE